VVEWLLDAVVLQNVNSFENLEGGAWWPFTVPPNSAEMADQILAAQMRVMKSGDRYDVISDVQSWREGGLEAFIQASSDAIVKRGVVVRRIFNLYRSDLPEHNSPLYQDKCEEMIEILNTHIRYATQAEVDGRYEIKVFWTDSAGRLKGKALRLREKFKMAHFGLFRQNEKPNTIICVKVEEDDLSDMLLSWDGRAVALNLKYFKEMWKVGTPLDPTELNRIATGLMPNRSKEKQ